MRITSVETIRPAIQSNLLFVRLTDDTGETGLGEAFFGARAVEEYIHETAARTVLAMDEVTPEGAAIALRPYLGFQGGSVEVRGNAAIDLALWDLVGKSVRNVARPTPRRTGEARPPHLQHVCRRRLT